MSLPRSDFVQSVHGAAPADGLPGAVSTGTRLLADGTAVASNTAGLVGDRLSSAYREMITMHGAGVQRVLRPHVPGPGQLQPAPVSPLTVQTVLL